MMRVMIAMLIAVTLMLAKEAQISQKSYKAIMASQEAIDAQQYDKALHLLQKANANAKSLNDIDKAYLWFYSGYVYALDEKSAQALDAFDKALAFKALPPQQRISIYENCVQLSLRLERYDRALKYLDLLMNARAVKAEDYYIKASIYLTQRRYSASLKMITKALAMQSDAPTSWLQVAFYDYYMLERYSDAITITHQLLARDLNNAHYYEQLASLYALDGKELHAFAMFDMARINQLKLTSQQWKQLVVNLRIAGVPYKAAVVLEQAMQQGGVPMKQTELSLLGELYYEAKSYQKALSAFSKSMQQACSATIALKQAQLAMLMHDYAAAATVITKSLACDTSKKVGERQLLLAQVLYETKQIKQAKAALMEATHYKQSASDAKLWLEFLAQEL